MGKKETPNTTKAALSVTRQGGPIVSPGRYPCKLDSVAAEVLACCRRPKTDSLKGLVPIQN